jgi:hypothetical protein
MPVPFTRLGNPEVQNPGARSLRELIFGLATPCAARKLPTGGNGGSGPTYAALDFLVTATTPAASVGQGGPNAPDSINTGTYQLGGHFSPIARMGDYIGVVS